MYFRFLRACHSASKGLGLLFLCCTLFSHAVEAAQNHKPVSQHNNLSRATVEKNKKNTKSLANKKSAASVQPKDVSNSSKKPTVKRQNKKKPIEQPKIVAASAAGAAVAGSSFGWLAGLHSVPDPLDLKSSVALVVDQDTNEILFRKNDHAVLPIASITKLMTGLLVVEADLPMDEMITITQADVDTEKNSYSRLRVGTMLPRGEMLHLALMASENRAAHALGRTFPGGLPLFVQLMNDKARLLGMSDTQYVEPTGLSSRNQSSAHDLATLVKAAHSNPLIRKYSTSPSHQVVVGKRTLLFNNTNNLVKNEHWDIGVQKTGFINEAGRCLVMQAEISGRKLIMIFLDSVSKYGRQADAERVRRWLESGQKMLAASH